ncbi:hypothetical protein GCM10009634_44180 [Saccharothrix xinjiangensis]
MAHGVSAVAGSSARIPATIARSSPLRSRDRDPPGEVGVVAVPGVAVPEEFVFIIFPRSDNLTWLAPGVSFGVTFPFRPCN